MLKLFPAFDPYLRKNQLQSRLIGLAALLIIIYALILTFAPAVRLHTGSEAYQFKHWLGVFVWIASFTLLHYQTLHHLPNRDPFLLPIIAALSGIGLMTIWRLYPNLGLRQTAWLAIGSLITSFGVRFSSFLDYLRRYKYIWLILGLIMTALTIILGQNPSGDGPTLWLHFVGIYFQPSEPLKLLLISYLAGYFSDRLILKHQPIETFIPIIFVTGIAVLLLVFQRDLGTASIFLLIFLAMLFSARSKKWLVWLTPILILIAAVMGYLLIDIVQERIDTWLTPFKDPTGSSYQVIQSMIALAEGGIIGTGPGLGSPGLIPVSVSDFIFSAVAEEMGFLGALLIIMLIILLIYRGVKIASSSQKSFYRYLSLGLVFYFGFQSILIIGGNIGLLPLTGVTLPLVSYGGSSLTVSFAAAVILLIISDSASTPKQKTNSQQPRYALVSCLLIITLFIEILASSILAFWFKPDLVSRPENPRWIINDRYVPRGRILDKDNRVIIETSGKIGNYQRISNYVPLYPIVGYTNDVYGQTGIEAAMFDYLRGYEGYSYSDQFWKDLLFNQPPEGLDVRLTIDLNFQQYTDELLNNFIGSAVLMNADTGEILAMASHPNFDAANLEEDWEKLIANENAPLLNRTTQGLYPAGTSLLPFILTTQIELLQDYPNPEDRFPNLSGHLMCAQRISGEMTWESLVMNGCQSAQVALGQLTGISTLRNLYENLGFYTAPRLHLEVAEVEPEDVTDDQSFLKGQQAIKISPLQMALAASALTNAGVMPAPRIVNAYQAPDGNWITLPKLGESGEVLTADSAESVISLLQASNSPYWEMTAWAQSEDGDPITWFLTGTTGNWQGQPMVVVVVLESDNPQTAQRIGTSIIEQAIN